MTNKRNTSSQSAISEAHDNDIIIASREIFLHGQMDDGEDGGLNSQISNRFLKNLQLLESINNNPIIIHQQSTGGEWESGMMIYDAIRHSSCSFIFVCHGIAASMASIIPQAVHGKGIRLTTPNCYWLIHEGTQEVAGTVKQFESYYEFSKLSKVKMYDIYTEVCQQTGSYFRKKNVQKAKTFLKRKLESREDWWLTSEEAVLYGFADGILGEENYKTIADLKKSLV